MSKEIRRAKVSAKLAVRKVKREDTPTKIGLGVVAGFIVPCCLMLTISLF